MNKVVTFGEIMMRLQPPSNDRLVQANSFDIMFGGGEANVAVCLSGLGDNASFVTALPSNPLGNACIRSLKGHSVDTSDIAIKDGRIGVYYCEKGFSVRPSVVLYDRAGSVFAMSNASDYDWAKIFSDVDWFHFTGITPALSDDVANALEEGLKVAKSKGITVSCDLNYRKKLWSKAKACEVMGRLMKYVDVLIANEEDCKDVFGIEAADTNIEGGKLDREGYKSVCEQVKARFGIKNIAITMRESFNANENGWSALLYDGEAHFSNRYMLKVLDRVGGGDSFGAGLIHALRQGQSADDAINFAVACSAIKHTINGDFNEVSEQEVLNLIKNGGSGRVQR